jgi:hypothetical protein
MSQTYSRKKTRRERQIERIRQRLESEKQRGERMVMQAHKAIISAGLGAQCRPPPSNAAAALAAMTAPPPHIYIAPRRSCVFCRSVRGIGYSDPPCAFLQLCSYCGLPESWQPPPL